MPKFRIALNPDQPVIFTSRHYDVIKRFKWDEERGTNVMTVELESVPALLDYMTRHGFEHWEWLQGPPASPPAE